MRSIHAGVATLSSIFLGSTLLLGCSETGLERRPEPPGGEPPDIVDLAALGDGPGQSGFCGTIGSGGIRAIVPLGGDGAFAVAYGSGRIVIQEVGQTNTLRTLSAHTSPIRLLRVSLDNQLMVSAAENGEVKLWRVADGQLVRVVQATGNVAVALSPDGSRLALLRPDQVEVQRSIEGSLLWQVMAHGGSILAFSADGQNLFHGGGGIVQVRTASDGQMLRELTAGPFGVGTPSHDLSRFFGGNSRTNEVALLDGSTGQPLWTTAHPGPANNSIRAAASFSPDDSQIAYVMTDGTLNIVRATDGSMIRQWTITDGYGSAVTFSSTGTRLALGLAQGGFRAWDLASGELLVKETAQPGHMGPATRVAFSPDGTLIGSQATAGGTDTSLKVWRTNDAALLYMKDNPMNGGSRSFAISPDSATIALTDSRDKKVYLLKAGDGSLKSTIENADVTTLAFSPDGSWLIGRSYCADCPRAAAIRVWRVDDAQEQPGFGDYGMHDGYSLAFSRDGSLLVATAEGFRSPAQQVGVWRVTDRKLLWSRPAERARGASAAFSPDGRHVAVAEGTPQATLGGDTSGVVRIHVSNNGAVIRELSVPGVRAVTYTPTGELVTAGDAGVRVWRASDYQPIAEAVGAFTAVAVATDGQRLVAARRDGSLSLMCGLGRALQ